MTQSVHNLTTKVFATEFGFGHYCVLIYDDKNFELCEMSRPMDRNGVNATLEYGEISPKNQKWMLTIMKLWKGISMEELMDERNNNLRTAIKIKQESFYS